MEVQILTTIIGGIFAIFASIIGALLVRKKIETIETKKTSPLIVGGLIFSISITITLFIALFIRLIPEPTAFTAYTNLSNKSLLITHGKPTQLSYKKIIPKTKKTYWNGKELKIPRSGVYVFQINFVRQLESNKETANDIKVNLRINKRNVGYAWAPNGASHREEASFTIALHLRKNDVIDTTVHADNGDSRALIKYSLTVFSISDYRLTF